MLNKILVPLDGSDTAEGALEHVGPLAARAGAEVVLLMAVWPGSAAVMPGMLDEVLTQAEDAAKQYLATAVAKLKEQGVEAEAVASLGTPAQVILETAERDDIALVALSTHGRTGLSRFLLGSVAERVLRLSPVPVLLLRSYVRGADGKPSASQRRPMSRILVPVDTPGSAAIAPMVAGLADLFASRVDLLHVVESPSGYGETSKAEGALDLLAEPFEKAGVTPDKHLRHGETAAQVIADFARENTDVGLIVMRTHGRDGMPRWVLGSVAETVAREADVPVLVVRRTPKRLSEWRVDEAFAWGAVADDEGGAPLPAE